MTLFFVGLCIIPCGTLKKAHADTSHAAMTLHEMKAKHSCHVKEMSGHDQISVDKTSSCPHCKSDIPVIMQEVKVKYLSPELTVNLAHWHFDNSSIHQKIELPGDDPPPGNQKHPIHILHSVFII